MLETVDSQPFEIDYKPTATGNYNIKAIVVDETGKESEFANYTLVVNHARTPYKGVIDLPGVIEMENFDKGGENFSFHDSDSEDKGKSNYRTDNEGVDIVKRATGYVVGYTAAGEWLEYTVNVTEPGKYTYEATVASTATGAKFSIGLMKGTTVLNLATVSVPQTGSIANYQVINGNLNLSLSKGEQVIRIRMINGDFRLDKIELKCTMSTGVEEIMDDHQQESDVMYNMQGLRVNEDYRGLVIKNGRRVLLK